MISAKNIGTYNNRLYIGAIILALVLHVFNTLKIGDIKVFQYAAFFALIVSSLTFSYNNKLCKVIILLIVSSWVSALLSPYPGAVSKALTFTIIIGACLPLERVPYNQTIKIVNIITPLPLIVLLYLSLYSNAYRFVGYYVDPNYMCTTLLVFLFIILEGYQLTNSKFYKLLLICEIVIILVITISTLSRTGLACICLLIFLNFWKIIKSSKLVSAIVILVIFAWICGDSQNTFDNIVGKLESRESNRGNFSSATNLRLYISENGINFVFDNPKYILFGLGPRAVGHWDYFDSSISDRHIDHNTLTAFFSETGIIGFILYVSIWYLSIINIRSLPLTAHTKRQRIYMLIIIFVFSLSINQTIYLPFWWILFLLNNNTQIYENNSHSRFREIR